MKIFSIYLLDNHHISILISFIIRTMVNCNRNSTRFRYPNHLLLHLFLLFIFLIPSTNPLTFNLTTFGPNDKNLNYEKDANPAPGGVVQLTANQQDKNMSNSLGRATYSKPLHLWDKKSGNLTDFTTHFSFVINSLNNRDYGDGMAFFLANEGSKIPTDSGGGAFALTTKNPLNSSDNPFVAVEFDTFKNGWDPQGLEHGDEHVGIDINSMQSVTNVKWWCDIMGGEKNDAWITYNSSSHNLRVVFTGFRNNTTVLQSLHYVVDLRSCLQEWVTIGFSSATGDKFEIHSIYSWSFSSTLQIDENVTQPTEPETGSPNLSPAAGGSKNMTGLAVLLGVGGCVLVTVFGFASFVLWKRRNKRDYVDDGRDDDANVVDEYMDDEFEKGTGPKRFSYVELTTATNNFKDENKLGRGGFGAVYRGYLSVLNAYVAVKRVSKESQQGIKEYASEVKIISRLRHRNLVQLIGWCHERKDLLLVYEFMPNGSLDLHLFKEKSLLTWGVRYKIAQGLASAVLYLHEEWEQCVVHRDIKSSNVMLDSDFNAKLGDFGLARLVDHAKGSQTTVLAGTMGYMAPECATTGKANRESDIYSFGIVAMEIACGRLPINHKAVKGQVVMVEWVWELYGKRNLNEGADPRLCGEFDEQQLERLLTVGLWCAHPDSASRPSIRQAVHALNFEAPLPSLPLRMPVATYFSPPLGGTDSDGGQNQYSYYSDNTSSTQLTASTEGSSPSRSLLYNC